MDSVKMKQFVPLIVLFPLLQKVQQMTIVCRAHINKAAWNQKLTSMTWWQRKHSQIDDIIYRPSSPILDNELCTTAHRKVLVVMFCLMQR